MRSGSPTRTGNGCDPGPSHPAAPASGPPDPRAGAVPARRGADRQARLDALRRDLGASLAPASASPPASPAPPWPTGLSGVDRLLGGGLPRGRLCELSGPLSSGLTSLALSLLATTTRAGHCAGLVDPAAGLDPPSAKQAGVDLGRVLWARPQGFDEARRCVERLLAADGFPLVVMDLARPGAARPPRDAVREHDAQTWLRLSRLAAATGGALVVLSRERRCGGCAHVALEMQPGRACFSPAPALLEEIEGEAVLVRHRAAPIGMRTVVRSRTCAA